MKNYSTLPCVVWPLKYIVLCLITPTDLGWHVVGSLGRDPETPPGLHGGSAG